ncbi:TlpA family protein disulfide reductase [Thiobacillus sp.]|uniref:TlpA family protein disulfide reductase n=1 Tax=Thiobacillus sp. TaxID=924 RepID=UPI00286DEE01|nr:redoxin family protein [Thiobacillus sp.]
MKIRASQNRVRGRIKSTCTFMSLASLLAVPVGTALADSKDGTFPTAEQVGGQVYIDPVAVGQKMPTDFDTYDMDGQKIDLGTVVQGKRSMVVFFISAVPVSVNELAAIEDFTQKHGNGVNLVFVNADTVGSALMGGPKAVIPNSVKTMHYIKKEKGLKTNKIYVAPNDALSAESVSTRLGIRGLPTSFLLDDKGVVQKVFVGPQKWKKGDI